jgi:hypothetical protein
MCLQIHSSKYIDEATQQAMMLYINGSRVAYVLFSMFLLIFLEPNFPDVWRRLRDEESLESEKDISPSGRKLDGLWIYIKVNTEWTGCWTQEPAKVLPQIVHDLSSSVPDCSVLPHIRLERHPSVRKSIFRHSHPHFRTARKLI